MRFFKEIFLNFPNIFSKTRVVVSSPLSMARCFIHRIFSLLFGEKNTSPKISSLVRGKCEYDVSLSYYSSILRDRCEYTRGKRIRGVGPRTYFTHHGRSASVPAKGGFILSRFTMVYGVGLAASTNNCQLNVPSIDPVSTDILPVVPVSPVLALRVFLRRAILNEN